MRLDRLLSSLGYCSRSKVKQLVDDGVVTVEGHSLLRFDSRVSHHTVRFEGQPLDQMPGLLIVMHKPCGYVCSHRDQGSLVFELLPARFSQRNPPLSTIGRLDKDSSGVLLFTDDGQLLHKLTSPKFHLPRVYEVELFSQLKGNEAQIFASGTLLLDDETDPLKPAVLEVLDPTHAKITIHEGRYRQVRRMFAAVGNQVTKLERVLFGKLSVTGLKPGAWRLAKEEEII